MHPIPLTLCPPVLRSCIDPRYYEPGSLADGGCSLLNSGERTSFDTSAAPDPATDYPMTLDYRRWGPLNRNGGLKFREMAPSAVAGPRAKEVLSSMRSNTWTSGTSRHPDREPDWVQSEGPADTGGVTLEKEGPFDHPAAPRMKVLRTTTTSDGITVDWTEGALWLAGIDGQWSTNPFHWFSKIGALFDARRSNSSDHFGDHPSDGWIQAANPDRIPGVMTVLGKRDHAELSRAKDLGYKSFSQANSARYRVGPQWGPLPPMDNIVFAGDGSNSIDDITSLGDWYRSTLRLATPLHSVYAFKTFVSALGPKHLVCSARGGAIVGSKTKFFTGRADAWIWRQYAYMATGLSAKKIIPHSHFPPRKITLIDRKDQVGRGIFNREEVVDAIARTGIPFEVVDTLGKYTFAQQVALMAGTGILIAPHGAALANSMFLPVHSVVVEAFPYLMKKTTYRHLATMADLHYMPLYSWDLLPATRTDIYGVQLMNEDYFWNTCTARNISSYDALREHACNAASKNYPIVVNMRDLDVVLRDAADIIGAFAQRNAAWKHIADAAGIEPPQPPRSVVPTKHGMGSNRTKKLAAEA